MGASGEDGQVLRYLRRIGAAEPLPATSPFDPGVAPVVLESHLARART